MWKSRWPSWVPRPYGLCGRKATFTEEVSFPTELRICVKVGVAVRGFQSLTVLMVSVDVKQHWTWTCKAFPIFQFVISSCQCENDDAWGRLIFSRQSSRNYIWPTCCRLHCQAACRDLVWLNVLNPELSPEDCGTGRDNGSQEVGQDGDHT